MAEARPDNLLSVGYVRRAHGLQGEVTVRLTTNRSDRLDAGSVLYTSDVELVVSKSRANGDDWLVLFESISDRNRADDLRGAELFGEPIVDPDELWVHDLIGRRVVDQHDVDRGVVESVDANPASDLLVLDTGHLVPLTFVTGVDDVIQIEAPDGLFDL